MVTAHGPRSCTGRRVAAMGSLAGALLLLGVVFPAGAQAAPGDLDLTFSGDGKQRTDFGFGGSRAAATVRQPDGKIVAVGQAFGTTSDPDFALARYNANGSLDTSFSGDGMLRTDFGGGCCEEATGVALQGDGKIVAVGGNDDDFALARYNPNGSLDTGFSGDGKQTTDFGGDLSDQATGVAIQGDGKVVVVGRAGLISADFALARYNPNGSLDSSFSGDGKQTTDFFGGADFARGVALQGDGKIVAVGFGGAFVLARYNPNGSLDPSFSGDGRQTTSFGGTDFARGVALQGDGKIVAVGGGGEGGDFALARYNPNGSLDTSFSGDGRQTTDFGDSDEANGVTLQGDGKIVAVGDAGGDFALARYNPNGSLDTSFSGDGKQTTSFNVECCDEAHAVALQGDGKIVAVGVGLRSGFTADFALARYNPNGSLDPSFSGDGMQTTGFAGFDSARSVALQGDGKIVVVGGAGSGDANGDFVLARYNPSGSLDSSFSGDGKQTTDFGGCCGDQATGVAIQGNGKIVVVGFELDPFDGDNFALARYNPNGSLDTSFSGDGKQTTSFGGTDFAQAVALQGGKIVAVGSGAGGNFALARYNPNGSLDSSFSGDGKQTTNLGGFDIARGAALQANGRIVAVGEGGADDDFALARYNVNGTLDTSFSSDGKQTTNFGGTDFAGAVALQGNGRIVAAGGAGLEDANGDFALARYNPNGTLDTSFSGDGKQTTNFGGDDIAPGVALTPHGKIVAVGGGGVGDDFALARYNTNGSLDTSFSADGRQTTDFGGDDAANGLALQGNGKIVAVGVGLGTDGTNDFALARYLGS